MHIKFQRLSAFLALFMLFMSTVGCWNYTEVSDMAIVAGFAIDKDPENELYILTIELINLTASARETTIQSKVIHTTGKTIFDSVRNTIMRVGRRLYWSHAKVAVIGESIAREGLSEVLDWIYRDAEVRSDMWILIAKDTKASEIFHTDHEFNQIVSFLIDDILQTSDAVPKFEGIDTWEFLRDLSRIGTSAILPTIELFEYQDKTLPQINGTAIFSKDRMIGWLDGEDTMLLKWLRNEIAGGIHVPVEAPPEMNTKVSLELFNADTIIKPTLSEDVLHIDVQIQAFFSIAEIGRSVNIIDEPIHEVFKSLATTHLQVELEQAVANIQKEYGVDILGFGRAVRRKYPDYWRTIEHDWNEVFIDLPVTVQVSLEINHTGLTTKPIQIGD